MREIDTKQEGLKINVPNSSKVLLYFLERKNKRVRRRGTQGIECT